MILGAGSQKQAILSVIRMGDAVFLAEKRKISQKICMVSFGTNLPENSRFKRNLPENADPSEGGILVIFPRKAVGGCMAYLA